MPFNNLTKQKDLVIDASLSDIFDFAYKRETIRLRKESGLPQEQWTTDRILSTARFNNIFREDDKTTKEIFSAASDLSTFDQWRTIFVGRYINRVDRLSKLFPLQKNLSKQISETFDSKLALTNSCAYQLHSQIGKLFNVKGAKDAIHHIDYIIPKTYDAILSASSIIDGVNKVNTAFGGYINFMAYQCILDYAQLNNITKILESDPYIGMGAHATSESLKITPRNLANAQNHMWINAKRKMYPFDAENLMCEFRKYHKRKQDGIQSATSKYIPNFLGKE